MLPTETKIKIHNDLCTQLQNRGCESINLEHNFKYLGIVWYYEIEEPN